MAAATIASIDTIKLRIPLDIWAPPPLFAGRPRTHVDMLLVRVATEGGVVGWGEAFGSSAPLGGIRRKRVEAYASLLQYGGAVGHVRKNVARALERGYRHIKLHERTADAVAAARAAAGPDVPIMVDTNCAWTADQASAAVAAMAPSKPFWVEEPIWPPEDFAALAALKRATGVPLAMGENASGVLDF